MSGPHVWSTNPANNGTIDSRAQWQVGMNANAVDGAARGLMASVALARDDSLGTLVATLGAGNVYTVTTGQNLIDPTSTAGGGTAKISHPFAIRVVLPAMNVAPTTTAPTIIIDGAAAVPLLRRNGTALVSGDLSGLPCEILGDTVVSGAVSRVRILGPLPSEIAALIPAQQTGTPIGGIVPFTGSNTPTGHIVANGPLLSRTTYAALWAHAQASGIITDDGTWQGNGGIYTGYYSTGDGSTTFRAPAINGAFLRALDYGRGLDSGRGMGTLQGSQNLSHNHGPSNNYRFFTEGPGYQVQLTGGDGSEGLIYYTTFSGGNEARPVNMAYPFLIRAY